MSDEGTPTPDPAASTPPMPPPPSGDGPSGYADRTAGLSTGPHRPAGAPESGLRRQGGFFMMAGALIVLASLPLAEVTASDGGITRSVNGMHGVALWLLIICGFAFMRGYSAIRPTAFRTSLPILSGAFVVWAIYDRWTQIDAAVKLGASSPGVTVSPGIGFWITCLGGALVLVGSVILQFVKPQGG